MLHAENKLVEIKRTISEIDKDHNGYITSSELDDILKIYCPGLENASLTAIIQKFSSIQNKILIDYKGFINWVRQECQKLDSDPSLAGGDEKRTIKKLSERAQSVCGTRKLTSDALSQMEYQQSVISIKDYSNKSASFKDKI